MDSKLQPVQLYGFSKSRLYEPLGTAIFFRNRFCPVSWIFVFLPVHFYGYSLLDVSPKALDVPDIDSYTGLMHTLFTLEDRYGLEVCECEDEVHLRVHIHKGRDAAELHRMLSAWGAVAAKLKAGEITKEEYDRWRYSYPKYDTSGQWHKITPSQELSDLLLADLKEHTEE